MSLRQPSEGPGDEQQSITGVWVRITNHRFTAGGVWLFYYCSDTRERQLYRLECFTLMLFRPSRFRFMRP